MPSLASPVRFVPYLRPMVWGGRGLAQQLGKTLPADGPFGEAWDVSDHALHQSLVADGPFQNTNLRDLMEQHKAELLGPAADKHRVFPWLIKFLDCHDWLSVQVHPDTATVQKLRPGEGSKTEAWYILHAKPGSRVYAGLKPGVGPAELREGLARGTVADLLHAFEPKAGDCVFLPAGTVHAVGGGVLMAEIQETSDVTFRLFDWNRVDAQGRGRELHLDESFASIHWDKGPVTPIAVSVSEPNQALVRCPFFDLDHVRTASPLTFPGGAMQTLIVIEGSGTWTDGRAVSAGQTWVLPAAAHDELRPHGLLRALLATLR